MPTEDDRNKMQVCKSQARKTGHLAEESLHVLALKVLQISTAYAM